MKKLIVFVLFAVIGWLTGCGDIDIENNNYNNSPPEGSINWTQQWTPSE